MPKNYISQDTAPLKAYAIFLISDPESNSQSDLLSISPAIGMEVMMTLVAQTFTLDVTDKGLMAKHFRHCVKILDSKVSCFQLGYPRDHSRLADGRIVIESAMKIRAF